MFFQSFTDLLSDQNKICSCRPVSLQGRMSFRYMTGSCVVFSHTHGNMSVTLGSWRLCEPAVVSLTVIWLLFTLSFVCIFDWDIIQRAFLKEQSLKFTLCVSDPDPSNVSQDLVGISISSMLESAYTAGCKADHDHGQRPDQTQARVSSGRFTAHPVWICFGSIHSVLFCPDMICFPYFNDSQK